MSQARPSLIIPKLNPLRLYDTSFEQPYYSVIPDFYNKQYFCQLYQKSDTLQFQLAIENDPSWGVENQIIAALVDINGTAIYINTPLIYAGLNGYYYYNGNKKLEAFSEGLYRVEISIQNVKTAVIPNVVLTSYVLHSEPIFIKSTHVNSCVIKYTHNNNNEGMLFVHPTTEGKLYYYTRVAGGFEITGFTPSANTIVYRDQQYDLSQLQCNTFNVERFTLGDGRGVANYQAEIINRILSLQSVSIETQYRQDTAFIKAEGAKMERIGGNRLPLAAWNIDLEQSVNNDIILSEWLKNIQAKTGTDANVNIATIKNGDIINDSTVISTGDIIVLLGQSDKTENGMYQIGATAGTTERVIGFDTDASCDGVMAYLTEADKYDNYFYGLYYDETEEKLMSVTYTRRETKDKGRVEVTGETKEIIFNAILYSIPTMITLQFWDSTGMEVTGIGYDITSVSVSGMTVKVPANDETLICIYEVE